MLERGVLSAAGGQDNAGLSGGEQAGGGACHTNRVSGLVGSGPGSYVNSPRLGGSGLGRLGRELGGGLSSRPGNDRPGSEGQDSRLCGKRIDCGVGDNRLRN